MTALFLFVVPCFEYQTLKTIAKMVQFDKLEIVTPQLVQKLNFIVDVQMCSLLQPGVMGECCAIIQNVYTGKK